MNQDNKGGLRCHDADACAMGQKACPTPGICGCAPDASISDAQIDAVFEKLPDGAQGFLKSWGYRQFARKILALHAAPARPVRPDEEFVLLNVGTNDIQLLPAGQQAAPDGFFSYCDDDGFNTHGTLEAAKADAQNVIDMLREEAGTDEWPGAVDSVCYGVIVGKSTEVPQEPGPNGEETADYLLLAATPEAVNPSETPNSSTIAVPRGWKLVPDDATPEWIENLEALPDWREAVGECIKKFLAAAPAAPQAVPAAVAVPDECEVFEDGAWYWVEKEGWIGDPPTIEPARYKAECDAWYSVVFSGIPTRQLKVLEPCLMQARAALAATPAAAHNWDGKLPERLQRALNELRIDCKTDAASSLEFEVRSAFEGMHTSLATVKRLYHAAQKRLDSVDAAQPDPFAAAAPVVLPEPDAYLFQHEDTGQTMFVEAQQVEWGFEANNPRLQKISGVYTEQQVRALLATGGQAQAVERGEVLVTVSGFTGSGKSAIAGEIEILCRALGLQVEWPDGDSEKNMTHADWTAALEQYKPRVHIVEQNIPFAAMKGMSK